MSARKAKPSFVKPSAGSIRATAVAFRKYAPALHRYLLRRLRRVPEAQDLTQEVFERYLRVANSDTVRNPQAYLFGIATHVVADAHLREEQSLLTYDSEVADEAAARMEGGATEDLAERLGFEEELEQALAQLPEMHRAVVLLAVREGRSHREVAMRTGLTEKTVSFYVFEAKARLRTILRPSQDDSKPGRS